MYPEIERKLKKVLDADERKSFVSHFYRLQLLIDYKVKDKRLREHMQDEAEFFRQGMEDQLRSMQVNLHEMKVILDRQWDRLHENEPTTLAPSS